MEPTSRRMASCRHRGSSRRPWPGATLERIALNPGEAQFHDLARSQGCFFRRGERAAVAVDADFVAAPAPSSWYGHRGLAGDIMERGVDSGYSGAEYWAAPSRQAILMSSVSSRYCSGRGR